MLTQCQRRKDISSYPRDEAVAAHQSGKVYMTISEKFKSIVQQNKKIIYECKTLQTAANLPSKLTPRLDRAMLRKSG